MRGGVPRNANMVELADRDVGSLQAIADCGGREPRTVLLAVEAFFLYGRNKLTILYDRGRGVAVVSINSQNVQRITPIQYRRCRATRALTTMDEVSTCRFGRPF